MSPPFKAQRRPKQNPDPDHELKLLRPIYKPNLPGYSPYRSRSPSSLTSFSFTSQPMAKQPPINAPKLVLGTIYIPNIFPN